MSTYPLIRKVGNALDDVEGASSRLDLERLALSPEYFFETYRVLEKQIRLLEGFRRELEFRGRVYGVTRGFSLSNAQRFTRRGSIQREVSPSEFGHLLHYARMRSLTTSQFKVSLDRVRAAVVAHRITLAHMLGYASIHCEHCGEIIHRGVEFKDASATKRCPHCSSESLVLTPRRARDSRLPLIVYLPISGNYMQRVLGFTATGRAAYSLLLNLLKYSVGSLRATGGEGSGSVKRGRPSTQGDLMEGGRGETSLFSDRYVRVCLAVAYTGLVEHTLREVQLTGGVEENLMKLPIYVLAHDLGKHLLLNGFRAVGKVFSTFPRLSARVRPEDLTNLLSILEESVAELSEALNLTFGRVPPRSVSLRLELDDLVERRIKRMGVFDRAGFASALVYLSSNLTPEEASNLFQSDVSDLIRALEKIIQAGLSERFQMEKFTIATTPKTSRASDFLNALGADR